MSPGVSPDGVSAAQWLVSVSSKNHFCKNKGAHHTVPVQFSRRLHKPANLRGTI